MNIMDMREVMSIAFDWWILGGLICASIMVSIDIWEGHTFSFDGVVAMLLMSALWPLTLVIVVADRIHRGKFPWR